MKKVLSLFLAVIMTLSVFSCLTVVAGATTSDLVVDTEYTVPYDTTWTFIPEESGYYKFESFGNGDPEITIFCGDDELANSDDVKDLDFVTVVYLDAGDEVSCYLHNHEEDDCVFTITKAVGVESISVSLVEDMEIMENTRGYIVEDYYWNAEDEKVCVEYFQYTNINELWTEGNTITVNYTDGSTVVYTCDDCSDYVNEDGEVLSWEYNTNQTYNSQWGIGCENYITVYVSSFPGVTAQVPVTIVENPCESIEFSLVEPIKIIENTNGEMSEDLYYDEEIDEEVLVEFFRYDIPYELWNEGNTITVNYKDGTSEVYTCDYFGDYVNSDGEVLSWLEGTDQSYNNQWTLGSDNYITIECYGKETQVPVTIVENPYESIEFAFAEPVELVENVDGYWTSSEIWNEETEEWENVEYFCYDIPDMRAEGNTITINYKDGSSEIYTCDGWDYVNSDEESLDWDYYDFQEYDNQWTLGSDNYIKVVCYEMETKVPITIVENPYKSIEFIPAEPISVEQYTNGYWDSYYDEETDESVSVFCYYVEDLIKKSGNVINLVLKDGSKETYTCGSQGAFFDSEGNYLSIDLNYNLGDWDVGSDNVIVITAMGVSCETSFTITENENIVLDNTFVAEKLSDDTCVITDVKVDGYFEGVLDVPEEINGLTVVGIEDGVLENVWGLEILNLPASFDMISENLFNHCCSLSEVNVDEDNEKFASVNGVLYNKALTEILYCPENFQGVFVIKAGVTELSPNALVGMNNAASVEIEDGNTAFAFEDGILYSADFKKIYKAFSVDADYVMKDSVTELAEFAFSGNETVESVTFSAGVTEISYAAFADCYALESVEFPEALVSIDVEAFCGTGLTSISIPASTKRVGDYAFWFCESLSEINLNNGLEALGEGVFVGSVIEEIVLPDSLATMGSGCFRYNENLSDVTIGASLTKIPASTFNGCISLEGVEIPENITVIGNNAFGYSGLKSIELHNKITDISGAFEGSCLTEVSVPNSVVYMDRAFSWCDSLVSANVGSGVKSMDRAFVWCENLETLELAEGISGSADYAFMGCSKLDAIDLPSTITELSYAQFDGCEAIDEIDIPGTLYKVEAFSVDGTGWYKAQANGPVYLEHVLYDYKGDMPDDYCLTVKAGTTAIAESAFLFDNELISVTLPEGLKYIGDYAFDACSNLMGIEIPASVEYIGKYALGYAYNGGYNIIKNNDFVIYGVAGSVAEKYANENGFNFISVTAHTHTPSDWIIDKAATCTTAGSKHKECTGCGETVETAVITSTGHIAVKLPAVAATCTTAGKTEGSQCSVCKAVIKAQTTVAAKGHTAVKLPAVAATCTTAGKTEGSQCSVCKTVIKAQTVVAAKGHTVVKDAAVAATCTTAGKTEGSHCSVCKATIKAQTVVAAKGHTVVKDVAVAATCAKAGKTEGSHCSVCKVVLVAQKTINATGKHIAGGWITDKSATSSAAGSMHKECTVCKKVLETKVIAQLNPTTPKTTTANAVGGVQITWNKVDGAVRYVVYRRTAGSRAWVNIGTTTELSLIDKNVKSGTYYCYSVRAYNSANGYSAYNQSMTSTRKYMASPKLTTIYNHVNGLAIKWNAVGGVTKGYRVYRRGAGQTYWKYLGTTKNTYWIDSGVKNANGGYYRYTVIADGGYHSAFDTTGLYLKRLANPALKSATSGNGGITVKWSAIKGTTGYYVYRKTSNSTWQRIAAVGGTNSTAFVDKTAKRGTTYTYTVRACYGYTLSSYNSGISCKR